MIVFEEPVVAEVFAGYPEKVREKMYALRDLIFTTAEKAENVTRITETLKWGEPSYLCQSGSTLRIDWKEKDPLSYRMFFHCQTKLVETFRVLYTEVFEFEGNRAIRFAIEDNPDLETLAVCIEAALNYHAIKDLPLLGLDGEKC